MTRAPRIFLLLIPALLLVLAHAGSAIPLSPDESRTRGTQVPDVTLIDEDSTTFSLSKLAGKPVVINPIFTSCPQTCPLITGSLRDALAEIGEPGVGYNVLTISFDPADGPEQLRGYRERLNLPAGWTLAVATPDNLHALLSAIDFNYEAVPGGGFAHANVIVILTPTLVVSSYAHGVSYDADELRDALAVATGESSFVHHYRPVIFGAGAAALVAALVVLMMTRRRHAQA